MSMSENYVQNLKDHLEKLNAPTDLVIKHNDKSFHSHKLLACAQSDWFCKALHSNFAEGNTGVLTLHDGPEYHDAIHTMIQFFHGIEYRPPSDHSFPELFDAAVCVIAYKYQCSALFAHAKTRIRLSILDDSDKLTVPGWLAATEMVYEHFSARIEDHELVRRIVLAPLWCSNGKVTYNTVMRDSAVKEFLYSNATAAVDILLNRTYPNPAQVTVCKGVDSAVHHVGNRTCEFARAPLDTPKVGFCTGCEGGLLLWR